MFKNFFKANGNSENKKTRRAAIRANGKSHLAFQALEPRRMLAGIFFDSASSVVTIAGGSGDDAGSFLQIDSTTYRAILSGSDSRDFAVTDVEQVVFIGFGGDDTFNNGSNVQGLLLGGSGEDTLRGGSNSDIINGGTGNDRLHGNEGEDRIVGGDGADRIWGDDGNDRIFAGDGANQIQGGDGDDFIFGGADADRIFGGNGIDQIFALAGNDILFAGDGGVAGSSGTTQADLILGHGGDDQFIGGNGLNVFYGGDGNDTLAGGEGENRLHGQNGDDMLTGGSSADYIAGHLGDDTLLGNGGNDFIWPGQGDDFVDAGLGIDTIAYRFDSATYTLNGSDSRLIAEHVVDGRDVIDSSERLRFQNGDLASADQVMQRVTVQPIVLSNSDGTNQAEFFGNEAQEELIKLQIEKIFAVAGVDIDWLTANHWQNTFANVGDGGVRPRSDLNATLAQGDAAGVGNSDPLVIDLYFVEIAAGFGDVSDSVANGLANIGANGISMHVGDDLLNTDTGLTTIARVAAHEIAHNLGLTHVEDPDNLLNLGEELNASQIATILDSQFTIPT